MSEEGDLQVKTMKEGSVTVPKELKVTYKEGLKLSDADLSSTGWTWADGDAALTVGTGEYPAYFDTSGLENTHDFSAVEGYDKDNHRVERKISVIVEKGTSTVTIITKTLDKPYDGGAVSAPEYTTSGSKGKKTITWQENKGTVDAPKWENIDSAPSEVGNYRVVVTLAEDNNYKSAEAALKFVISKAENVWTEELSIEGWTYGSYDETKNVPSAEAKFGDVVFTYSDKQDGTYKNEAPENAGTWYVKAAVAGTENYTGLEAVQEFVIKKAIPTPDEVTGLIIVQGHPLSELELPEQFRWEDETQIAEELGTHILFATQTAFILQNMFQSFLVAAEEPVLSLKINIAAGLTNVVFDYLFIAVFEWGVAGAAIATGMGQIVGGIAPFFFFAKGSRNGLRITWRTKLYKDILLKTCMNGSSEMVTNLSTSLVNILYNFQLMKLAGADGVAAFGVIMYVNFIFVAVFMGYSVGSAPIVSYHYGAGNDAELHNLYRKSKNILIVAGIVLTIAAEILSMPLVRIFVNYDKELLLMTVRGFRLFSFSFLIMGINIWASSFFTALNNGFVSAAISFLRTFLFQVAAVCFLPLIIGIDGVWTSVLAAETMALAVTIIFLIKEKKKYRY